MTQGRPNEQAPILGPQARNRKSRRPMTAAIAVMMALPVVSLLAASSALPDGEAVADALVDPALLDRLQADPGATFEAFVTFDHPVTVEDGGLLAELGLTPLRLYPGFQVAFVAGLGTDLLRAAGLPGVLHLHGNDELQFYLNTATVSTRARDVWDAKSTSAAPIMAGGAVVTGAGIGVAVIDSGIDDTHPDLAAAVTQNLKYACTTPGLIATASNTCYGNWVLTGNNGCVNTLTSWVPLPISEVTSGHGTHVAGIVAGRGTVSAGRFTGVAPGASIVGLGTGEVITILYALEAFNWVGCNGAANGIRIVTNSWGSPGAYVATDPINMAVTNLVGNGYTVLFAAGNNGPATGNVNRYARNPTQGVIGVASSYDNNNGARGGSILSSFSSRCATTGPAATCPDVTAPGQGITSTVSKLGPTVPATELNYLPYYGVADGTSMATPHVAGVVALLLDAVPALTPAAIENILEDTAIAFAGGGPYTIADPSNAGTFLSHRAGHGLVNAVAALETALGAAAGTLGSPQPQTSQGPHVYVGGADGQLVGGVQWTVKSGVSVQLSERSLTSGDAAVWPLAVGQACRFRVFSPPGTLLATLGCSGAGTGLTADGTARRMDAAYTFPAAGTYAVEPQISFGGTYRAIDSFQVNVPV